MRSGELGNKFYIIVSYVKCNLGRPLLALIYLCYD